MLFKPVLEPAYKTLERSRIRATENANPELFLARTGLTNFGSRNPQDVMREHREFVDRYGVGDDFLKNKSPDEIARIKLEVEIKLASLDKLGPQDWKGLAKNDPLVCQILFTQLTRSRTCLQLSDVNEILSKWNEAGIRLSPTIQQGIIKFLENDIRELATPENTKRVIEFLKEKGYVIDEALIRFLTESRSLLAGIYVMLYSNIAYASFGSFTVDLVHNVTGYLAIPSGLYLLGTFLTSKYLKPLIPDFLKPDLRKLRNKIKIYANQGTNSPFGREINNIFRIIASNEILAREKIYREKLQRDHDNAKNRVNQLSNDVDQLQEAFNTANNVATSSNIKLLEAKNAFDSALIALESERRKKRKNNRAISSAEEAFQNAKNNLEQAENANNAAQLALTNARSALEEARRNLQTAKNELIEAGNINSKILEFKNENQEEFDRARNTAVLELCREYISIVDSHEFTESSQLREFRRLVKETINTLTTNPNDQRVSTSLEYAKQSLLLELSNIKSSALDTHSKASKLHKLLLLIASVDLGLYLLTGAIGTFTPDTPEKASDRRANEIEQIGNSLEFTDYDRLKIAYDAYKDDDNKVAAAFKTIIIKFITSHPLVTSDRDFGDFNSGLGISVSILCKYYDIIANKIINAKVKIPGTNKYYGDYLGSNLIIVNNVYNLRPEQLMDNGKLKSYWEFPRIFENRVKIISDEEYRKKTYKKYVLK